MKVAILIALFFFLPLTSFAHGAIAICNNSTYGMSWNYSTKQDARNAALNYCSDGGKIVQDADFNQSCAAIAKDPNNQKEGRSARYKDESSATQAAISTCEKYGGVSCEVVIKACDTYGISDTQPILQETADSRCDQYGFQKGTNAYAQCLMQIDIAQRQMNAEIQSRANRHNSCQMAKANAYLQPTRTGNFFESQQLADQTYNNCMAGLPPPKSGLINCNKSGDNITCFAQ